MADEPGYVVRRVAGEWCLFHPSGREVARSANKPWLESYISDAGIGATTVWQTGAGV